MPKAPTMRSELIAFLGEQPQPIRESITKLSQMWNTWRADHNLLNAGQTERSFRQAIARAEELGFVRLLRDGRPITGIEMVADAPLLAVDNIRRLERERAMLAGRFVEASDEADRDLLGMRTPALNGYVRRRRTMEKARREYAAAGLNPKKVQVEVEPLGEEALALKERLIRNELELLAWRDLGAQQGIAPDLAVAEKRIDKIVAPAAATKSLADTPAAEALGVGKRRRRKTSALLSG